MPDQVFDRTKFRPTTFFGDGIVAHVSVDQPFCVFSADDVARAGCGGLTVHRGGTYVCIEGPSFSTKAGTPVTWDHGFSVVGMAPRSRIQVCPGSRTLLRHHFPRHGL